MQRFVQVTPRKTPRFAFVAGVAATHVVVIAIFLMNDTVQLSLHVPEPKEITLMLRRIIPALPKPVPQESTRKPKSNAITLPYVPQNQLLNRLGTTLACRSNYENLSPEERAHCALAPWTAPDSSNAFMLGVEPPSIWAQALAERKAPFVPMFSPCDIGAIGPDAERGRLGLSCVQPDPGQAQRWGKLLH